MKKKILVVDDAPDILEVVQLILEGEGYDVQTSPNGGCFKQMKNDLPHLILLDVLLAGEDGREICQRLKSSEQTKHIPVILFSAHAGGEGTHGADAFLAKPFHIKGLVETVQRYV